MFDDDDGHRRRPCRHHDRRAPARAGRPPGRRRRAAPPLRSRSRDPRGRGSIEPGPWVAHVSGATPLAALDPHERRFSVHPLQTLAKTRGPEQLDGAWAAVHGRVGRRRAAAGSGSPRRSACSPFMLADDRRALYHAGASIASNFLVTLYRVASDLVERAGAPPEALVPLMERTIANGFELTGPDRTRRLVDRRPASRGAARHRLASSTTRSWRRHARDRRALDRGARPAAARDRRLVPTMGALHGGHAALFRAARAECDVLVASVFVNPAQFPDRPTCTPIPATRPRRRVRRGRTESTSLFAPPADEMYPAGFATWVEPAGAADGLEGAYRPGHFRGVATVCLKLFNLVRPQIAWFGRRTRSRSPSSSSSSATSTLTVEISVVETARDTTDSRSRRGTHACRPTSGSVRARSRAR